MIAGRDTTAATLTFIIYFLSKHPEVMKRLREEVLAHIGPESRPSYDKIKDMKYLRAVINGMSEFNTPRVGLTRLLYRNIETLPCCVCHSSLNKRSCAHRSIVFRPFNTRYVITLVGLLLVLTSSPERL